MSRAITTIVALLFFIFSSGACEARSAAAVRAFKRDNPCPSTNRITGPCPGHVVDHIEPLCAGGADKPENMQWQTVAAAKVKDKEEWRTCRELKKRAPDNRIPPETFPP